MYVIYIIYIYIIYIYINAQVCSLSVLGNSQDQPSHSDLLEQIISNFNTSVNIPAQLHCMMSHHLNCLTSHHILICPTFV